MPITPDLKGALPPVRENHFASITEPTAEAYLLRAIDGYEGTFIVKSALRLAPLVFVRPGELRHAEWAHIDLDAKEWRYLVTGHLQPAGLVPILKVRHLKKVLFDRT